MTDKSSPKKATGRADTKGNDVAEYQPTHLQVRSLTDGFRRAGRAWSSSTTTVPVAEFSEGQIKALLKEPNLLVELVVIDDSAIPGETAPTE